jgi:DNA-binding response OmpR family regulator
MSSKPVILVVDDDAPILVLMRNVLREFGFEARVASDGQQAIAAVRQEIPDLILLDKNMPGMTLHETMRGLRQSAASTVPVLILSGEPLEQEEIAALGANGAVMKPFDVPELVDRIRSHVGVARQ